MSAHKELIAQFAEAIDNADGDGLIITESWAAKKLARTLADLLPADKPEPKYSTGELLCLRALRDIYALAYLAQEPKNDYLVAIEAIWNVAGPFVVTGPTDDELDSMLAELAEKRRNSVPGSELK